jgi:serine/threonine-protein phosphatase Stp1
MQRLVSRASTHRGTVRPLNEDAFVDRGDIGLWAVADGAGGESAGDVASSAIARSLTEMPSDLSAAEMLAQVRSRLDAVHADLQRRASEAGKPCTIASTAVVLMARDDHCACLWAGDSRAYLFREGSLVRLTRDHSVVEELVEAGLLAPEATEGHPHANIITRAVGGEGPLELDKVSTKLASGDILLLCSDGLNKVLSDSELETRLAAGDEADELIEAALAAGAKDNVTAVIVHAGAV